ncbi:MAG: ABC transporter substrate-binding protein [Chloroflexi bacterium]|jgi:peptide/nickel transport system substrate-binding protein|nr:ABC transporter substrate-binding protein [Chloroflexota bacterium]MBV6437078.1 Glutathione-binding protein GsiB [Anaerolineae bacterium]MDL1916537.1 ABC transporter substrate-binding protein [Anaerolineae bacterium CFX4]OQY81668.1 MAG: ABC transporter substrate-binding protein [Anaerolineae bacterium UTCFX5]MCC6567449.1 ABC transporter substrate-binding protein [Chloroflexota bacterium]
MRKAFFALVLIALVALAISPAAAQGNVLVMARAADTTGLDPHTQTAFASFRLLELIYEPLVSLDADLNVIPALAESWNFADDGMTLSFTLRQGVKFHNGADFTSADVAATFARILDEATGAAARANYLNIASIDTPDDYTVVFNLSAPDVPLLAALATTNAAMVDSADIESGAVATVANGTGPFVLENWTPEETTTLSANADWWGDGPNIDGIEIRIIPDEASILAALRAGTIDFALLNDPLVATLLIGDANVQLNRVPAISYNVLQLRAAVEPLDKLEVRQAISCAIDRQEVLDTASLGEGIVTGPLTMAAFALPTDELFCYEKDLDKARELMAAAGMSDGFTLKVIAANAEPPTALSEAQSIQAQLAEIGITVEIESLELSVYVDRWLAGDFEAAVALNGGRPDPYTMYARYWQSSGNLNNVAGYIDETLDDLMARGRTETDPEARYEIFAELQHHLTEMAPWVWLYTGYEYTAQLPAVQGFVPYPTDSLIGLAHVTLSR